MFRAQLKNCLTGSDSLPAAFYCNFEVEEQWAKDQDLLTSVRLTQRSSQTLVNHMDELGILLAGPEDTLLLRQQPDEHFLRYLREDCGLSPSENIQVLDAKVPPAVALENCRALFPMGVTSENYQWAKSLAPALPLPEPAVVLRVNSKIFSRRLCDQLRIEQIPGTSCESMEAITQAVEDRIEAIENGTPVALKEAMGVSGKGITVLDSQAKARSVLRLLQKQAERYPDKPVQFVVETWVAKQLDFNTHFMIGRDGTVTFNFVKDIVQENGVHKGHRIPTALSPLQVEKIQQVVQQVGRALYEVGYFGVVGLDGILTEDGTLYPVLEINARFNMSTYHGEIQKPFTDKGYRVAATCFGFRSQAPIAFSHLKSLIGECLYTQSRGKGVLINSFATVNAAFDPASSSPFPARLYCLLIGETDDELRALDERMRETLRNLT